jgi:ATP-dependent RNA helicase RhlE
MDFDMLGLSPRLVAALAAQGITDPTPIQSQAIPHAMNGRDVLGLAQTGTGKTAAFAVPLVHAMADGGKPAPRTAQALVLAPTRELARQISDAVRAYAAGTRLSVGLVVGGASMGAQIKRLERGTDILVATPGRLIDLLDRGAVRLDAARFLVLDEADQMLDLGFIHALRRIAPLLPAARQTMLFSATMPKQMGELADTYLRDPVRVAVAPPGTPVERIRQSVHFVGKAEKPGLLLDLLSAHPAERALVFVRTKHGADRLARQVERAGFAVAAVHGNRSQGQRERALAGFRSGATRVLVATDVAARGLDIPDVRHVYNFDLPNVADTYVHRIGRTARAGADGAAVAFCAEDEMGDLRDIQKVLKAELDVASGTPWRAPAAPSRSAKPRSSGRPGRNRKGGGPSRRAA